MLLFGEDLRKMVRLLINNLLFFVYLCGNWGVLKVIMLDFELSGFVFEFWLGLLYCDIDNIFIDNFYSVFL